jgi:hypothetical protein
MKYIITENQFDRILSDETLSYFSKTVTRAFKSMYPQIEEIVVSQKLPYEGTSSKLFNTYVYVDKQLGPITEREIAESVGSFIQENFDIISRKIFFDSVHFHYNEGTYLFVNGRVFPH